MYPGSTRTSFNLAKGDVSEGKMAKRRRHSEYLDLTATMTDLAEDGNEKHCGVKE